MNDLTKSHYQTLSEADQTAFISKSTAEQDEVITKALEANAVIFTSADGTEFRKSDDPRMVAMAKRADEADAALAKSQEQAADLAIETRATSEFSNLPGEVASQVDLLKAVAGIENKESREAVLKLFNDWYHRMEKRQRKDYLSDYLNAFTSVFDPHTNYFLPADKENFDIRMSGRLEGIGARLMTKDDFTEVSNIVVGGPAWKQKDLEDGDSILVALWNADLDKIEP